MTPQQQLQQKYDAAVAERSTLMSRFGQLAAAEGRPLGPGEVAAIDAVTREANGYHRRLTEMQTTANQSAAIERLSPAIYSSSTSGGGNGGGGNGRGSLGQQFVNSEAYRAAISPTRTRDWQTPAVEIPLQATTLDESAGSGGPLVLPDTQAGIIPLPTRRLVVADLLAPGTTTSTLISFMKEKTFTNAAAAVAQGAAKPETTLVFENATSKVEKVAHWIPVTDEILQDVAQMSSYLDARMRRGVDLAEDDELLNGSGVTPHLAGLLHLTAPAAPLARTTQTNVEALLQQASAIELATGLVVDAFVLNPAQWLTALLLKTTDGAYLSGSPFDAPRQPALWGRKVAISSAIVAGTGLVGCFATGGAQLFRHGGMRVDVSNSHSDFFVKNLIAVRAETRVALAVYRESAFGLVTNLS